MFYYKVIGNVVCKYRIQAINRQRLYNIRKGVRKYFVSNEIAKLIDKLLEGDISVAVSILNAPNKDLVGLKECFELGEPVDTISIENYHRMVNFFGKSVQNGPAENNDYLKMHSGHFYHRFDRNVPDNDEFVKFGVELDVDRLVNLKLHVVATCLDKEGKLSGLLQELLDGNYDVVPDIYMICNSFVCSGCLDPVCSQFWRSIQEALTIKEVSRVTGAEFKSFASFLTLDCPSDYLPTVVLRETREDIDVLNKKYDEALQNGEADLISYYQNLINEELQESEKTKLKSEYENALASGNEDVVKYYEKILASLDGDTVKTIVLNKKTRTV